MLDYILILVLSIVIPILSFLIFMWVKFEKSTDLTIVEKIKCEKDIKKNRYLQQFQKIKDPKKIAEELSLEIVEKELGDLESVLCESDNEKFNGTIMCEPNQDLYKTNFRCLHEIVHYVLDVGYGKQVKQIYGKNKQGATKSHREQKINYIAAAIAIPMEDIWEDIKNIDSKQINEEFHKILQEKYQQPIETIQRRIKEVQEIYLVV